MINRGAVEARGIVKLQIVEIADKTRVVVENLVRLPGRAPKARSTADRQQTAVDGEAIRRGDVEHVGGSSADNGLHDTARLDRHVADGEVLVCGVDASFDASATLYVDWP